MGFLAADLTLVGFQQIVYRLWHVTAHYRPYVGSLGQMLEDCVNRHKNTPVLPCSGSGG